MMKHLQTISRGTLTLAAVAAVSNACGDATAPLTYTVVASPSVLSDTAVSATRPLITATVLDSHGQPVRGTRVFFDAPQPAPGDARPINVQLADHEVHTDGDGVASTTLLQWGPHAGTGWIRVRVGTARAATDSIRVEVRPGVATRFGAVGSLYLLTGAEHALPTVFADQWGNEWPAAPTQCTSSWVPVTSGCRINATRAGTDTVRVQTSLGTFTQEVRLIRDGTIAASGWMYGAIFHPDGAWRHLPLGHHFYGSWLGNSDSLVHSIEDGGPRLRVTATLGTGSRTLPVSVSSASVPVSSRDGAWIFFERDSAIWRIRRNATGEERITPAGLPAAQPSVSPQGGELVFVGPGGELHILDITTRAAHGLGVVGTRPRWSPAGDVIAHADAATVLALVTPNGSAVAVRAQPVSGGFDWSPDGTVIIGSTPELVHGRWQGYLWQLHVESGGFVKLPLVPQQWGSTSILSPVVRPAWKQ